MRPCVSRVLAAAGAWILSISGGGSGVVLPFGTVSAEQTESTYVCGERIDNARHQLARTVFQRSYSQCIHGCGAWDL